jgi:hypothetical protein
MGNEASGPVKPRIEIFHYEPPYPQAYVDSTGQAKIGGIKGLVKVRVAKQHGAWGAGEDLRSALKSLMRTCKSFGMPYLIETYEIVLVDTVRCDAFREDGTEVGSPL